MASRNIRRSNKNENNFRKQLYWVPKTQSLKRMVQVKGLCFFDAYVQTEIKLLHNREIDRKHKFHPISINHPRKHSSSYLEGD